VTAPANIPPEIWRRAEARAQAFIETLGPGVATTTTTEDIDRLATIFLAEQQTGAQEMSKLFRLAVLTLYEEHADHAELLLQAVHEFLSSMNKKGT
jgi:hypothetical protein